MKLRWCLAAGVLALTVSGAALAESSNPPPACVSDAEVAAAARVESCTRVIEARGTPHDTLVDAYHWRGNAYYDEQDYARAIADYSEAIRLDPEDGDRFYNRGTAYQLTHDYPHALA